MTVVVVVVMKSFRAGGSAVQSRRRCYLGLGATGVL